MSSSYFCPRIVNYCMENIRDINEVLGLLFNAEKEYTVKKLYNELMGLFGEDIHFSNSAGNVFPIQEVVPFLLGRGKIRLSENTIIPLTSEYNY